ncbi:MAG: uridine kinase [Eubacterium sp.]|nr:uridine kinase [Eubacterium sp.]
MMDEIIEKIENEIQVLNREPCIIAIDGRCASGKTTLAKELSKHLDCSVVHMDDFFLQPYQRTSKRLSEAGGNIDYERFLIDVIHPIKKGTAFSYHPFDCHSFTFSDEIKVDLTGVIIIEGTYSCHPKFKDIYDLKIFLDIDCAQQLERIEKRNGKQQLSAFKDKWIPLEEKYFEAFCIKEKCDMYFELKSEKKHL